MIAIEWDGETMLSPMIITSQQCFNKCLPQCLQRSIASRGYLRFIYTRYTKFWTGFVYVISSADANQQLLIRHPVIWRSQQGYDSPVPLNANDSWRLGEKHFTQSRSASNSFGAWRCRFMKWEKTASQRRSWKGYGAILMRPLRVGIVRPKRYGLQYDWLLVEGMAQ